MNKFRVFLFSLLCLSIIAILTIFSCKGSSQVTTTPSLKSLPELKYLLVDEYPDLFWCDPYLYPIARPGVEQQDAIAQFVTIKANSIEFAAILKRLTLPVKDDYTDEEKLLIFKQHRLLSLGLEVTGTASPYSFTLRIGENPGYKITGTITSAGVIKVRTKETSFNSCPICLSKGTLISTPSGQIPVENLKVGMTVWTLDKSGTKIAALILRATKTPVPQSFIILRIRLENGRSVMASAKHPSSTGIPLGDYKVGDVLDGTEITGIDEVSYTFGFTFDILPAGGTGFYWADDILLKSTLTP